LNPLVAIMNEKSRQKYFVQTDVENRHVTAEAVEVNAAGVLTFRGDTGEIIAMFAPGAWRRCENNQPRQG
jgi:hypothetical protein